jgi:hypothetical protein
MLLLLLLLPLLLAGMLASGVLQSRLDLLEGAAACETAGAGADPPDVQP